MVPDETIGHYHNGNEEDKLQTEGLKPTEYQKHASFSIRNSAVSKSQMKGRANTDQIGVYACVITYINNAKPCYS